MNRSAYVSFSPNVGYYAFKLQPKSGEKILKHRLCSLLPDKYKWQLCHQPWPALGTAAKDIQTGRMSLKISKPQPWLRWHQRRA